MLDAERTQHDCQGCKKDREKRNEEPRKLILMPAAITANKNFNRPSVPMFLCAHCDGDTIEDALRQHRKRSSSDG